MAKKNLRLSKYKFVDTSRTYLFVDAGDFQLRTKSSKVQTAGVRNTTCRLLCWSRRPCHEARDACATVDQRWIIGASLDLPVRLYPAEHEWICARNTDLWQKNGRPNHEPADASAPCLASTCHTDAWLPQLNYMVYCLLVVLEP